MDPFSNKYEMIADKTFFLNALHLLKFLLLLFLLVMIMKKIFKKELKIYRFILFQVISSKKHSKRDILLID